MLTVLTVGGTLIAIPNDVVGLGEMFADDEPAPVTTTSAPGPVVLPTVQETTAVVEPTAAPEAEPPPAAEQTFEPPVVTTEAPPPPTRGGALVMQIRMGSGGKIGPAEYRAGAAPGANVDVFDDHGQLSAGCYPSWVLTREGVEVRKAQNGRCTSGGITMFNFGDSLDQPGGYRLTVSVVTDGGQSGSSFADFRVS